MTEERRREANQGEVGLAEARRRRKTKGHCNLKDYINVQHQKAKRSPEEYTKAKSKTHTACCLLLFFSSSLSLLLISPSFSSFVHLSTVSCRSYLVIFYTPVTHITLPHTLHTVPKPKTQKHSRTQSSHSQSHS